MSRLVFLPLLILAGCLAPEDRNPFDNDIPRQSGIEKLIGQTFELKSVIYTDGRAVRPAPGDVTLTIRSSTSITGKILCNRYYAGAHWQEDNVLKLTGWEKEGFRCDRVDPFQFEPIMQYEFIGTELTLRDFNNSWFATFVPQ